MKLLTLFVVMLFTVGACQNNAVEPNSLEPSEMRVGSTSIGGGGTENSAPLTGASGYFEYVLDPQDDVYDGNNGYDVGEKIALYWTVRRKFNDPNIWPAPCGSCDHYEDYYIRIKYHDGTKDPMVKIVGSTTYNQPFLETRVISNGFSGGTIYGNLEFRNRTYNASSWSNFFSVGKTGNFVLPSASSYKGTWATIEWWIEDKVGVNNYSPLMSKNIFIKGFTKGGGNPPPPPPLDCALDCQPECPDYPICL